MSTDPNLGRQVGKQPEHPSMRIKQAILYASLILLLVAPALANSIFAGNQPYQGEVQGTVDDPRFELFELAEALDLEVEETEQGWLVEGEMVNVEDEGQRVWVDLSALPAEVVRVVRNKTLGTLDLFRAKTISDGPAEVWSGGGGTIVYFYADWSEACQAMEQTMNYLDESPAVTVAFLNIDLPDSPVYRKYVRLFEGDKIPYFVLLDTDGKTVDRFDEFKTYPEMLNKLKSAFGE